MWKISHFRLVNRSSMKKLLEKEEKKHRSWGHQEGDGIKPEQE